MGRHGGCLFERVCCVDEEPFFRVLCVGVGGACEPDGLFDAWRGPIARFRAAACDVV